MKLFFTLSVLLMLALPKCFANQNQENHIMVQIDRINQLKQKALAFAPGAINQSLKSKSAYNKMLDKITYPDGSYKTFAYNEAGFLIDYKFYNYDSFSEALELQEHQEMEYDSEGNQTLFINRNLDSFDGFIIIEKEESTYQNNHIPLEQISWEYNEAEGDIIKTAKSVYTLSDATHGIIESYGWDQTNQEWKLSSKTEIDFIDFEHPNSVSSYYYDKGTEAYYLEACLEFSYNANGQETEMVTKYISEESGEMEVASTLTTTYDENGNIILETESGEYMGTIYVAYENVYTYENGLLVKEEYNSMFGSTYTEYSYTDGKLSEKRDFYEEYNDSYEVIGFSMQYKDQFFYNNDINADELAYPADYDAYYSSYSDFCDQFYFQFGGIDYTICSSWDYMTETVAEKYRGMYHYSDFKAGIQESNSVNELINSTIKFGPNPCSDILKVTPNSNQATDIKIYNTNGKTIHKATIKNNYFINTSSWEKGLYFIQTQSGTHKIIKY